VAKVKEEERPAACSVEKLSINSIHTLSAGGTCSRHCQSTEMPLYSQNKHWGLSHFTEVIFGWQHVALNVGKFLQFMLSAHGWESHHIIECDG
jgi:hypothetical protein